MCDVGSPIVSSAVLESPVCRTPWAGVSFRGVRGPAFATPSPYAGSLRGVSSWAPAGAWPLREERGLRRAGVRPPERTWAGGGQACLDCPAEECAAVERELAPASSQPADPRPVAQALRRAEAVLCPGTMGFEDAVLDMRFARDRVDGRRSIPERALAIRGLTRRASVSPIVVRGRRRRESSRQRRSSMCLRCASVATASADDGQSQNEL